MFSASLVKVKRLHPTAFIPDYQTDGAAALDLHACSYNEWEMTVIAPGQRKLIKSGLAMSVPRGYMALVTPRSGTAYKKGITVTNSPGIIDSDYRGDIGTIVQNDGDEDFIVTVGERISQLSFVPVLRVTLVEVDNLDETERGADGFGSTGA
jgi:dUTP pyrophosphatase